MTVAAIYTRVSVKDDTSNARQLEACQAFCVAKGWEVGPLFQERGITGTGKRDRPQWRKLTAAVEAKDVDAVVVFAISRAARNVEDLLAFGRKCDAQGIAFESVSEPIGGQYGRVFLALLGAIAELESKAKGDRASLKRDQMIADGLWPGGPRPFGLDVVYTDDPSSKTRDARLVINPAEAAVIRDGTQDILRGQSLGTVMRDWNAKGITTSLGKQWRRTSLRQLFLRPTLAEQPAILTKRDAEALRAILEDPARHHPRSVERYLLTGILVCGECGGRMQGHPAKGRRYMCRATGVMHRTIMARDLEDLVITAVSDRKVTLAAVSDPAGVQGPILKQLDALDAKLAQFAENAAMAGLPVSAIRSGTKALLAERERLERELEAVQPPPPPTDYAEAMVDEQVLVRAEIEALVDRVEIGPPIRPFNVFNPDRVAIVWR
jgi:DNA invertase Pin-like site-specific DNA recombinase